MSQDTGPGSAPPLKVETKAAGSTRQGATPAVVPDSRNTTPVVVPGGAEGRPDAGAPPGAPSHPPSLQARPPASYMQVRPGEPGSIVPTGPRPPYMRGPPPPLGSGMPNRPPYRGGGPNAPPSHMPPPFLGGAQPSGPPGPSGARPYPGPSTPGASGARPFGAPPSGRPMAAGGTPMRPLAPGAVPVRGPPSPTPPKTETSLTRPNAPALAPINTSVQERNTPPPPPENNSINSPVLERLTSIQPTIPTPLSQGAMAAPPKDTGTSRGGFSTLAGGTGNGPVPSELIKSPTQSMANIPTSPTSASVDGPMLDHSHLQPGETVSLLSHNETMEMYCENAKKSNDPQLNYELAVFMLDVARSLESSESAPESEAANEREALIKEATSILKKLADRGHCDSQYLIGDCYANGFGTSKGKQDFGQAYVYFTLAAKHGHPDGAYRAGTCYEKGWGCRRDAGKAVQFYRKAASQNHPGAQYRLGTAELNGELGLKRSAREGIKWLKRSAESATPEFPHALHELALLHEKGIHNVLFVDPEYSCELLAMAGEMGYAPSAYKLGVNYEYGRMGCPQDGGLSIHMYNIAAQQNHKEACFALTAWYLVGAPGILPQSDTEAYLWAKRAAEQGLAKAEYACGYFAEMGVGTRKDLAEAKGWYLLAAEHGDKRANQRLSTLGGYQAKQVTSGNASPSDESTAVPVQPLSAPFPGTPVNGPQRSLGVLKFPSPKAMRETQAFQRDLHYQTLVAATNERERSKEREALRLHMPPPRPTVPRPQRGNALAGRPNVGANAARIQAGPSAGFAPIKEPEPEPEPEPEAQPEEKGKKGLPGAKLFGLGGNKQSKEQKQAEKAEKKAEKEQKKQAEKEQKEQKKQAEKEQKEQKKSSTQPSTQEPEEQSPPGQPGQPGQPGRQGEQPPMQPGSTPTSPTAGPASPSPDASQPPIPSAGQSTPQGQATPQAPGTNTGSQDAASSSSMALVSPARPPQPGQDTRTLSGAPPGAPLGARSPSQPGAPGIRPLGPAQPYTQGPRPSGPPAALPPPEGASRGPQGSPSLQVGRPGPPMRPSFSQGAGRPPLGHQRPPGAPGMPNAAAPPGAPLGVQPPGAAPRPLDMPNRPLGLPPSQSIRPIRPEAPSAGAPSLVPPHAHARPPQGTPGAPGRPQAPSAPAGPPALTSNPFGASRPAAQSPPRAPNAGLAGFGVPLSGSSAPPGSHGPPGGGLAGVGAPGAPSPPGMRPPGAQGGMGIRPPNGPPGGGPGARPPGAPGMPGSAPGVRPPSAPGLPGARPPGPGLASLPTARPPGGAPTPNRSQTPTSLRPSGTPGMGAPSSAGPGVASGPGSDNVRPALAGFRPNGQPEGSSGSGAPPPTNLPNPHGPNKATSTSPAPASAPAAGKPSSGAGTPAADAQPGGEPEAGDGGRLRKWFGF